MPRFTIPSSSATSKKKSVGCNSILVGVLDDLDSNVHFDPFEVASQIDLSVRIDDCGLESVNVQLRAWRVVSVIRLSLQRIPF